MELFEELNQPLPEALRTLTEDSSSLGDTKPPSVRSLVSIFTFYCLSVRGTDLFINNAGITGYENMTDCHLIESF